MDVGSAILHFPPPGPGTDWGPCGIEGGHGREEARPGTGWGPGGIDEGHGPDEARRRAGKGRIAEGGVWLSWIVLGASAGSPDVRLTVLHF